MYSTIYLSETYKNRSFEAYGLNLPRIKAVLPTNLPAVSVNEKRIDNLFLLEDDTLPYEVTYIWFQILVLHEWHHLYKSLSYGCLEFFVPPDNTQSREKAEDGIMAEAQGTEADEIETANAGE